jgi:hypothetical protein
VQVRILPASNQLTKGDIVMPFKLNQGQKHILKLIDRDKDDEGWTRVSKVLCPHIDSDIPKDLIELEIKENGGRARLTTEGQAVIDSLAWLQ